MRDEKKLKSLWRQNERSRRERREREREEERRRERGASSMSLANLRLNLLFIIKTFFFVRNYYSGKLPELLFWHLAED